MSTPWVAVTGAQDPYVFDLPHVLSLPPGFEFRFRYRHKWVSDAVHAKLKANPKSFYAQDLIVCFHSEESRRVIPIRRCRIISVEEIGPVIFLRFSVGAFPLLELRTAASTDPEPSPMAMEKLAVHGRALLGLGQDVDLSRPLPREHYLRQAATQPSVPWSESAEAKDHDDHGEQTTRARAWASLVAALGAETPLHGVPLFHLLGFDREDGSCLASKPIRNRFSQSKAPIYGFKLKEGERYRLRLLEWCDHKEGEPQPAFRVNCEFANVGLGLEGATNLVVGRYDVLEYRLVGEHSGYGEILVRAEALEVKSEPAPGAPTVSASEEHRTGAAMGNQSRRPWPSIYAARVPVSVALPFWKLIGLGGFVPLGLGLYLWAAPKVGPTYKEFVELVGLLLLMPFVNHIEKLFKLREGIKKWNEPAKAAKN